jgi:SAM-dependent methyltransferase
MEDIGVGELIYEGEIYDRLNDFDFDLDFYHKWCSKVTGPVLELCCGTGRLTIPLKKRGMDIIGLDITESMLETARKKAEGMELELLQGDIRNFNLRCFFPLEMEAALKYNGFQVVEKFGNYAESPFESKSVRMIYICKRKM